MIYLAASGVAKHFGPEPVLAGVAVEVRPGDKIGLVGPNGTGKTTLMRILAGHLEVDAGSVERHSSASLGYLEQQPDFAAGRTVWEEARSSLGRFLAMAEEAEQLAHAMSGADAAERRRLGDRFDRLQAELHQHDAYQLDHKIERILAGLGFPQESFPQPVEQLSGGQQNRLLLAKLLLAEPDVLLLDEPSNHLDIEATEWLEEFLIASRQSLIVVSHDRYFLDRVTNRTWELFHGTVDAYVGNFSAYWRQKGERLEVQRRTWERQQEEIAKLEDFVRRHHYGQKHAQAEDRRKKLERIEQVDPTHI
ncbi:MAG: ATP-binding cassette domain-containing protein, partial [Planctomycetes bacterium]|nr:ATP-binding cassette domain-containing protein [Planctomycetota bacterium]